MTNQGYGKIFNMEGMRSDGRIADKVTYYGTSKSAVGYFTKSFSNEARDSNIQIGVLSPGIVMTDLIRNSLDFNDPEITKVKKIFNILANEVHTVTPFLCDGIIKSKKNYNRIVWLTPFKAFSRFALSPFNKNEFFK